MLRYLVVFGLAVLWQSAQAEETSTGAPPVKSPDAKPKIAIIIDDLGHHSDNAAFIELDYPLTVAIMPFSLKAEELAHRAESVGHEVMIHMPMQPEAMTEQTQEVLDSYDTKAQFIATLSAAFSRLPQAQGLNNHQGSLLTANQQAMTWLMHELKRRQLVFLDSRTSAATIAEATARDYGVPSNRRHVFLDNDPTPEAIAAQWQRVKLIAANQGYAIVIGHPYPTTLAFLQSLRRQEARMDYQLVYFSQLLCQPSTAEHNDDYCW